MRKVTAAAFVIVALGSCSVHTSQPATLEDSIRIASDRLSIWTDAENVRLKNGLPVGAAEDSANKYREQLDALYVNRLGSK